MIIGNKNYNTNANFMKNNAPSNDNSKHTLPERKAAQIEGFEQASEDKFKQENGMSMEDYSNEYWDKDNKLFNQYIDNEIDNDTYNQSQADLKKNYPEIDNITRH